MKWSRYNIVVKKRDFLIFNTVTGGLLEFDKTEFYEILKIRKNPNLLNNCKYKDELIENNVFVKNDEYIINKKVFSTFKDRLNSETLSLTIVPTMQCNLACSYCFQDENTHFKKTRVMSNVTVNNLLNFIKSYEGIKYIYIIWFGGEPTLAFNVIETITKRILKETKVYLFSELITNGYSLSKKMIDLLPQLNIIKLQITLDGSKDTHNRRRYDKNKKGTFSKILQNINKVVKCHPKILIAVRVNIDKTNQNEYIHVYNLFKNQKSNIVVYPGFIEDYSSTTCNSVIDDCIINKENRYSFLIEQNKKYGLFKDNLLPEYTEQSCIARTNKGWAIDEKGNLYKCLANIGDLAYSIGNINDVPIIKNEDLLSEFLTGYDYLRNQECLTCESFPICDGGCPFLLIKSKGNKKLYNRCHISKGHYKELISIFTENY